MASCSEPAAPPPGEVKTEWEISLLLAKKLEERAKARGRVVYPDGRGSLQAESDGGLGPAPTQVVNSEEEGRVLPLGKAPTA